MTGAGWMDCKKALTASDGDMDKAIEFLREKGLAVAAKKRSGRVAAEGMAYAAVIDGVGVVGRGQCRDRLRWQEREVCGLREAALAALLWPPTSLLIWPHGLQVQRH